MTKNISRRDLLKAILAGSGGFVATSFLPEKWLKPVVKSGVLPVHAQASAPDNNYVKGFVNFDINNEEEIPYVYAFVSSTPFSQEIVMSEGNYKLASPNQIKIDYDPVEGEEVSLSMKFQLTVDSEEINPEEIEELPIEYTFISTKTTDQNGFVKWNLDETMFADQAKFIRIKISLWCKFEILGDSDEIEHVLIDLEF